MADDKPDSGDVQRLFEKIVGDLDLDTDDYLEMAANLLKHHHERLHGSEPSTRRLTPRDEVVVYRVRVDLDRAKPPIWRRLDLRSDLTLDVVHRVLQAAFGWWDYHLHRFALGGGVFDRNSEFFLCPPEIEGGEEDGVPTSEVRLDETMQVPDDVLRYVYDYGDSWELTIRLEKVLPADESTPTAVCVDGRRAAPPEDSGGITDAEYLTEVLDDPAHFDIDEVNEALFEPHFVLRGEGFPLRLLDLVDRLGTNHIGLGLTVGLLSVARSAYDGTLDVTPEFKRTALRAHLWFLDHAGEEGFELTDAGYLKPAVVKEASDMVPAMKDWIGEKDREVNAEPLLRFRMSLQKLGLFRKYKGRLRLTKAGEKVADDPEALWDYLAERLVRQAKDRFDDEANLLLLAHVASSTDGSISLRKVVAILCELGWARSNGDRVDSSDVIWIEPTPLDVLENLGEGTEMRYPSHQLSPAAVALARAALLLGDS